MLDGMTDDDPNAALHRYLRSAQEVRFLRPSRSVLAAAAPAWCVDGHYIATRSPARRARMVP